MKPGGILCVVLVAYTGGLFVGGTYDVLSTWIRYPLGSLVVVYAMLLGYWFSR